MVSVRVGSYPHTCTMSTWMSLVPASVTLQGVGCHVSDRCINSLSYADDMVLLAPTVEALQRLLVVCQEYAAQHDMIYNTTKTECMLIPPRHSRVMYHMSAELNECPLQFVSAFTYLGHVLSWPGHV